MANEMKIEHINPFLTAASSVFSNMFGIQLSAGKPYVKVTAFETSTLVISFGVTGQISGQVLIAFSNDVACDIASKMCMMPIDELNELSLSALSELGNMILGNAATVLSTKSILVDITPPSLIKGDFIIESSFAKNICIPLIYDGNKAIELDISLKEDE